MPDDRAYIIGPDGHVIAVEVLHDHPNYDMAIKAAEQIVDGRDIEVWDRDRLVIRLKARFKTK